MPRSLADAAVSAMDEGGAFERALAPVTRRVWIASVLTAAGIGSVITAIGMASGWRWLGLVLGLAGAGVMLWRGRGTRDTRGAARLVERARPACRNVVITAEELLRHPERAAPWVRARVLAAARTFVEPGLPAAAVPLARPIVLFVVLGSAAALIAGGASRLTPDAIRGAVARLSQSGAATARRRR